MLGQAAVILSLFDQSKVWGGAYEATRQVEYFDLATGDDIRLYGYNRRWAGYVRGILMAPPCVVFANSGARWWISRTGAELTDALALVDAGLRMVALYRPDFWVLENPHGRLGSWLGPPSMTFSPEDYGDPWTKKTCLWGRFNHPKPDAMPHPDPDDRIHRMGPSADRSQQRSITPPRFAAAFARANP